MSTLKQDIIANLKERQQKVLNGGVNCIPSPFPRFRNEFPGTEQGKYIVVTGATKSSKTQISNYLFIYNTVLFIYHNPGKIRAKIFVFPLEETKEAITLRFMAFLLNYITKGKVCVSPTDLKSTDERKPVSDEILDLMNSEEFNAIFKIYDEVVTFYEVKHPTGINIVMENYAKAHGHIKYRELVFEEVDELTGEKKQIKRLVFDKYVPDDPDEYIIWMVDHVGLFTCEKDHPTIKQAIEQNSDNAVRLRNRYNYTYVGVQQQNSETTNLEAFKSNKIRPTKDGLKDSKRPGEDCDILIGMTCPNAFELQGYMKYDVTKLKDYLKILEVALNRGGRANILCPLFHDGAINDYKELPLPTNTEKMNRVYSHIQHQQDLKKASFIEEKEPTLTLTMLSWARERINNIIN